MAAHEEAVGRSMLLGYLKIFRGSLRMATARHEKKSEKRPWVAESERDAVDNRAGSFRADDNYVKFVDRNDSGQHWAARRGSEPQVGLQVCGQGWERKCAKQ
jgi:hypothetical protein